MDFWRLVSDNPKAASENYLYTLLRTSIPYFSSKLNLQLLPSICIGVDVLQVLFCLHTLTVGNTACKVHHF